MIRTLAVDHQFHVRTMVPLSELNHTAYKWYWVDFSIPTDEENQKLSTFFQFHPLAIEDCLHYLQRPKMDYYDSYIFLVLHDLPAHKLTANEVDIFYSESFIVTYHAQDVEAIDITWKRATQPESTLIKEPSLIMYQVLDKIVDQYFPPMYQLEDLINDLGESKAMTSSFIEQVFNARADLLTLRKTIFPMRDLLYRMLNSAHLSKVKERRVYFTDIYDHLLKLSELIESNLVLTSDMRDNYMSINSDRMNNIMMTLTVITTIFMPLTFIAGIYGMNFQHMPELTWHYGYFAVLIVMGVISCSMFWWFKRKGWFRRM